MRLRHVVTCFLRRPADGAVLLGQRSSEVSTYQSRWAAISGSVEHSTPLEQAYQEIEEETGLASPRVELEAEGWPIRFPDWKLGTVWVVHPYLFRCKAPEDVKHDWEHVRFRWVNPDEITELDTVPRLHEAYLSVDRAFRSGGRYGCAEVFRMVEEDRSHGAAELGLWTLMGLRAALKESGEQCASCQEALQQLTQDCRQAADLRPSMAPPLSAALGAFQVFKSEMSDDGQRLADAIERADEKLDTLIRSREEAPLKAAGAARECINDGDCVVTLSYSSTVLATIHESAEKIGKVIVAESRPACEGRKTARAAAAMGIETELMTDAAAAFVCTQADRILLGADSVTAHGSVLNKTGSLALSCVAYCHGIDTTAVTTTDKFLPGQRDARMEQMSPEELGAPIEGVTVKNPYFEPVPVDMINDLVTEQGRIGDARRRELHRSLQSVYNEMVC